MHRSHVHTKQVHRLRIIYRHMHADLHACVQPHPTHTTASNTHICTHILSYSQSHTHTHRVTEAPTYCTHTRTHTHRVTYTCKHAHTPTTAMQVCFYEEGNNWWLGKPIKYVGWGSEGTEGQPEGSEVQPLSMHRGVFSPPLIGTLYRQPCCEGVWEWGT